MIENAKFSGTPRNKMLHFPVKSGSLDLCLSWGSCERQKGMKGDYKGRKPFPVLSFLMSARLGVSPTPGVESPAPTPWPKTLLEKSPKFFQLFSKFKRAQVTLVWSKYSSHFGMMVSTEIPKPKHNYDKTVGDEKYLIFSRAHPDTSAPPSLSHNLQCMCGLISNNEMSIYLLESWEQRLD